MLALFLQSIEHGSLGKLSRRLNDVCHVCHRDEQTLMVKDEKHESPDSFASLWASLQQPRVCYELNQPKIILQIRQVQKTRARGQRSQPAGVLFKQKCSNFNKILNRFWVINFGAASTLCVSSLSSSSFAKSDRGLSQPPILVQYKIHLIHHIQFFLLLLARARSLFIDTHIFSKICSLFWQEAHIITTLDLPAGFCSEYRSSCCC